jgi:hypothetical protein
LKSVEPENFGEVQELLDDYEVKEASIIHELYSKHFYPKD